jgi:plasmid stabilization system protein ParE
MPHVIYSESSLRDLGRLHDFLVDKSPSAARRAIRTVLKGLRLLEQQPGIGRQVEDLPPEFREWIIHFGSGAYIVRYQYSADSVVVIAIRHSREA